MKKGWKRIPKLSRGLQKWVARKKKKHEKVKKVDKKVTEEEKELTPTSSSFSNLGDFQFFFFLSFLLKFLDSLNTSIGAAPKKH